MRVAVVYMDADFQGSVECPAAARAGVLLLVVDGDLLINRLG